LEFSKREGNQWVWVRVRKGAAKGLWMSFAPSAQEACIVCEAHSEVGAERVREFLLQSGYTARWIDENHLLTML